MRLFLLASASLIGGPADVPRPGGAHLERQKSLPGCGKELIRPAQVA
jgi:hypothetical protein